MTSHYDVMFECVIILKKKLIENLKEKRFKFFILLFLL